MQKLGLQQRVLEAEQATERDVQAVTIGKTAAENHARRLHQRVQDLEVGTWVHTVCDPDL